MIFEAMELVRAEIETYLQAHGDAAEVELGSIAANAGSDGDRVIVSLVNVEEEAALKNSTPYQRNPTGGFDIINPPIFLNLYLLVSANFRDGTYGTALKRLSRIVQCFQRKVELSMASVPGASFTDEDEVSRVHISLDLYSISFEKLSQLWGTLGGKQVPFVVYKVRVVEEQDRAKPNQGPEISAIERRFTNTSPISN